MRRLGLRGVIRGKGVRTTIPDRNGLDAGYNGRQCRLRLWPGCMRAHAYRRHQPPGSIGRFGWGGAAGTWFFVDPAEELVGLFFTTVFGYQFLPQADLYLRFEKMVYEALVQVLSAPVIGVRRCDSALCVE